MSAQPEPAQRITRLTPLADALAAINAKVRPVEPQEIELAAAVGCTLASDVIAASALPPFPVALYDGWAVRSDETADASSYAPAPLSTAPVRVNEGEPAPPPADAVAPLDAITLRGSQAEAVAPVSPGEGVVPAGSDAQSGAVLRTAGQRLRDLDCALLLAAGMPRVNIRLPRIRLVRGRTANAAIDAAYLWLAAMLRAEGAAIIADEAAADAPDHLEAAFHHEGSDAVLVVGGTGCGHSDVSVATLARAGQVAFHGVGLAPGETAGFGVVAARPVLLLPGRIDAALAAWLVLGRRWLDALAGRTEQETTVTAELVRKVTSTLGIADVIPVRCAQARAEPLSSGYLSVSALARADGWILVPPDSEGFPAGAPVVIRPLA